MVPGAAGAEQLNRFFHDQLKGFLEDDLDPTGRRIIECCLEGGSVADYQNFTPDARS